MNWRYILSLIELFFTNKEWFIVPQGWKQMSPNYVF